MRRVVVILCAALLVFILVLKNRTERGSSGHTVFLRSVGNTLRVKVSGDVKHPGIYALPANSVTDSVIKMADDRYTKVVTIPDQTALTPLFNGATVTITEQTNGTFQLKVGQMSASERMLLDIPLDMATMTEDDFAHLPGVGPALAHRIVKYRQKNGGKMTVEGLINVEGIGEKKYSRLVTCFQGAKNIE